jgi:hypothetical protein
VPSRVGVPTTKPTSASMSRRVDGPNAGPPSPRRWPHGRTIGVPETVTVPARPWYPIGRCHQFSGMSGWFGRRIRPTLEACQADE